MSRKLKLWIAGIIIAAVGIIIARLVAPTYEGWTQLGLYVVGIIIALGGLGVIMYGIKAK